jgi:hypothetical protein
MWLVACLEFVELTSQSLPRSSKEWMDWAMSAGSLDLVSRLRLSNHIPRVKIAILDTGYDINSQFFSMGTRHKRLAEWKDFSKCSSVPVDEDGHGTYMVSLAMKLAPAAEICVGRVATDSKGLRNAGISVARVRDYNG